MGSRGYYADQEPIHTVIIPQDFWLAETPVTQTQFEVWTKIAGIEHKNRFVGHHEHPAENVDWRQANAFCAWLTQSPASRLPPSFPRACLPTEAEWEYACRAGTESEYYAGDSAAALAEAGWFGESYEQGRTRPVREKRPNPSQLYDLHGNVWEWCHDKWNHLAYRQHVDGSPDPGFKLRRREWRIGLEAMKSYGDLRVLRGGSWVVSARFCRSAYRIRGEPHARKKFSGFRVCLIRDPVPSSLRIA